MTIAPEFSAKLAAELAEYRAFVSPLRIDTCRLVHYCGVDVPNAIDVPLSEVEDNVTGCLAEGFCVGWLEHNRRLFIYVQEPGCPLPERASVVAEAAIADVDAILREAGFDPRA